MRLLRNTLANFAASFLGPILALFLTPFYLRHLGLEGYGLVGFFTALHLLLGVVSAAMGKVYLREVAARSASASRRQSVPALFQLFLAFFGAWGLFVAGVIAAVSWWISHRWIHLEHLSPGTVQACILFIALTLAATLPTGVCTDTLFALQEQVRANSLSITLYLLTTAAAVTLVYLRDSVLAYYCATSAGAVLSFAFSARLAARRLRAQLGAEVAWPRFAEALREGKADALEVMRSSLLLLWTEGTGVIITQTDRLLLTSLLPISTLGIYNLGSSLGRLVQMTCMPFLIAAFPRLCQLAVAPGDRAAAARHAFRQQAIVLVLASAFAMPVCAIPETLLTLWIRDAALAARVAGFAAIFALAYACLALSGAPYNLAVATGHTRYAAIFNAAAVLWYPLLGWWLITRFGLRGAALLWLSYCASCLVSCTLVAWLFVDRGYFALRETLRVLAVPALAVALGFAIHAAPPLALFPLWSRVAYATAGTLAILSAGLALVLGRAGISEFTERWLPGRRAANVSPHDPL